MDDYSIVRDEYYFIKEKAFQDIQAIQKTETPEIVKDKVKRNKSRKNKELTRRKKEETIESDKDMKEGKPASRKIACPVHHRTLVTVCLESVTIDFCPECFGIWLDFGEMEQLLNKRLEKNKLFKKIHGEFYSESENKHIIKNCPVCGKVMEKKKTHNSSFFIDHCALCGGMWFDSGEFAALYLKNRRTSSVQELLAGVIGNYIDIKV